MANGRLTDRKDGLWARIKRIALTDVGALMRGLNADDLESWSRSSSRPISGWRPR